MNKPLALPLSPPLIIGATGGSGTRVIAKIAQLAGFDIGSNLNGPNDALEFFPFYEQWIDPFIDWQKKRPLAPAEDPPAGLKTAFVEVVGRHLSAAAPEVREAGGRWGWKTPRSIYLLPFFHAVYPGLKFIQVVRDGRDMAVSKNQNQLRKHGQRLLSWTERRFSPAAVQSILLWNRVNLRAAEYGAKYLGANYLLIRFEDLCGAPEETTARILAFLGATGDAAAIGRAEVKPPPSLGRWRGQPPELIARLEKAAAPGLRHFSYSTGVSAA